MDFPIRRLLIGLCLVVFIMLAAYIVSSESSDVSLQVKVIYYDNTDVFDLEGILKNGLPYDLKRTNLDDVRVFCKTPWGWSFYPHLSSTRFENGEEFLLRAGETEELAHLGAFVPVYDMAYRKGPFLLEMGYQILSRKDKDADYVVYSNEFTVPGTLDERSVASIQVTVQDLHHRQITLRNSLDGSLWFNPLCSKIPTLYDYAPTIDPYVADERFVTLQRKTEHGTWQIFRPERSDCIRMIDSVKIGPGTEATLKLWEGYPIEKLALPPGAYRWNIVLYRKFDRVNGIFAGSVHVFTGLAQFP